MNENESGALPAIGEVVDLPSTPQPTPAPAALPPVGTVFEERPAAEAARPDLDARLRTIFQLGLQVAPSDFAGANYLARTLDLPPALVAKQYPLFKKAAEAAQFDPARFRRENPGLVELLLENPQSGVHPKQAEQLSGFTRALKVMWRSAAFAERAAAPVDAFGLPIGEAVDVEAIPGHPSAEQLSPPPKLVPTRESKLKGTHGIGSTYEIVKAEGRRGLLQNELGDVGYALLVSHALHEDTEVLRRRQLEIEQELGVQVDYGQNAVEQALIDAEKAVMSQAATLEEGGKWYAVGAGVGTLAGLAGTRSPVQALKYGHAVGMILGKAGFSYGSFKQEAGSTFAQLLDEKLDDGTPLDRDVAAGIAFLYGVAAAAVEVVSFGELAKSLGPLKTMIAKGEGRAAIRAWAADRSKREILRAIGKQWAKSAASEALEEGTQTTLQYAITWAGKSLEAGKPQKFDTDAFLTELGESVYLGGMGGLAMATPPSVVHAGVRVHALEASLGRGELVAELAKLAGTEAALGAPRAVADLVVKEARRAGAGDISSVYLDAEAAETFFQKAGTDAATALSELLGEDVRAKVAAAKAGENLGRIEIPLAQYLEKLGPTGVAEALAGDTAVRPFDPTLNERVKLERDMWAEAEEAVQLWQKTGKVPEPEPGEVAWADEIAKRAAESGAASKTDAKRAQLVARAFVRTMVKRYGEPVRLLMQRYAVDVRPAADMPALREGQAAVPQEGAPGAVPAPAPALAGPETIDRAALAGAFRDASGTWNTQGAAQELARRAQEALDAGRPVSVVVDGKPRPVRSVSSAGLVDEDGNAWSVFSLLISSDPAAPRVEIGAAPGAPAAPAPAMPAAEVEERLAQASPGGVDVLRRGDVLVLEHPESPLRLTVRDEGGRIVSALLGFNERVPEHVETIRAFGGQGYSSALYLRALEEAKALGRGFASDQTRTKATERMYQRLRELGVPFVYDATEDRWTVSAEDLAKTDLERSWRLLLAESEIKAMREGVTLYARKAETGAEKGWTRFYRVARKGFRQLFQIATTPEADASTLLHESAHVFLEIFGDIAGLEDAPAVAADEYSRILAWLGVSKREELTREHHERFAEAFETYLYEGKAPSLRLAGVFSRMRAWFLRLGERLRLAQVPLNDEIRGLFDRMLATDQELAALREQYAAGAEADIFPSPEAAGLTAEQYDAYLSAKERAFEDARIRVQQRILAEQQAANESALRAAGKDAKGQAATEFDELRESRVLRFLKQGDASGNPALRALVDEAREREAKEATKLELPPELQERLDALAREEEELRESGGTKRVVIAVRAEFERNGDLDGRGVPANLVPLFRVRIYPWKGQRLAANEQLRIVTLPAWLGVGEYLADREGWEWVWASGRRTLPQIEQRWLHHLVENKQLVRAWALGRILGAAERTEYQEKIAQQVKAWLATSPSARKHESPLAPRQWETLAGPRSTSRFRRWEISKRRSIQDNITGMGDAVDVDEANDVAAALKEEDTSEARFAELAKEREALDREVAEARLAAQRGRVKLDLEAVVDVVGNEVAEKVFRGLTRADGGVKPDRLAELFTFETGEAMLRAIAALPDRASWVKDRAERIVGERHPNLLSDRVRLGEAVADAAHAKGDLEYFLRQWAIFRSKAGDWGRPPIEAVKRAAEGIVRGKQAGKLNLKLALDAETGAARRAVEAAGRGNWKQASVLLQQQLLNHFIYKGMLDARAERDELERMAKAMTPDRYRGQIGRTSVAIRDAIDQVLEATGLRDRIQRDVAPRPLGEAVAAMESFGTSVMFDREFLERLLAHPVQYTDLLVEDMRKVLEALKNLRAAALSQEEVIEGDRRVAKDDAVQELEVEAAETTPHLPPEVEGVQKSTAQRVSSWGASVHGEILRAETMISWLGGRDTRSAWYRYVLLPLQRAKHREVDLLRGPFQKLVAAFEKVPPVLRRRMMEKIDGRALFPSHRTDLEPPTRRFQLLMLLLTAGNKSGLDRVLDGRGITEGAFERAIGMLTRAELEWAQAVWDACEELWPLSRELEERDDGVAPPKLEARPWRIVTQTGEEVLLRGGYFPAAYAREVSTAGEKQQLQVVADILNPGFVRPGTPHSHLKGRIEGFADAIATDPAVIMRHILQVAHDLAFREPLKSVATIVLDPRIQELLKRRLGPERSPQFLQWLKDIGSMRAAENAAAAHGLVRLARRLKSNAAVGILAYAADVAAGDVMNLGTAVLTTPLKTWWWARGLAEFIAHPFLVGKLAAKKSGEIRFRRQRLAEEFRQHIDRMTSRSPFKRGLLGAFKRHAFVFMEATDLVTSTPIWWGAYQQAIAEGRTEEESIVFADWVMGKVFPSHSAVDASYMVRRKDGLDLFLLFHGYANTLAQAYLDKAHQVHEAKGAAKKTRKMVELVLFSLALGSVASVAADFIVGHGPAEDPDDEDDELGREEWANWYVERLLVGWAYPWPLLGLGAEMATSIAKGKRPSVRVAPIYAGLEGIGRSAQKLVTQAREEGAEIDEDAVLALLKSLGVVAGVPANRPLRALQFAIDLQEGEVDETDPAHLLSGFIYGRTEGQGLNPLTWAVE